MADGLNQQVETQQDFRSRRMLLRRLTDVVALPDSASSSQDRAIAGDLLLEMLIDADENERAVCAKRLVGMSQAPRRVLRYLGQDVASVSSQLLEESAAFDQSDLVSIVVSGAAHHRRAIAARKDVGSCLSDAISQSRDTEAIARLLMNDKAIVSELSIDRLVSLSRNIERLGPLLLRRPELRPAHALVLFWWSDQATRRLILQRFSAERSVLIDMCSDIFAHAAKDNWSDPVVRKGLQVIERRQRNRAAIEKSPFSSLEDAIAHMLKSGYQAKTIDEISYLCGIKPMTGQKIISDEGGEGIAVLAKAVGLKRQYFKAFWAALGRPISRKDAPVEHFEYVLEIYEMMAVAKAQTVLRYWNWSLSSAYSPEVLDDNNNEVEADTEKYGPASRASRLVFGR
ncbi:DUF2336 domain-containing protein [Hirschia baltica]|uniref:DUF2336 domain-containing protein n=1 Tax=Hirschia baltica (strain ATCC 49814 / DSM 5838 / IFAM 1418) TaxID=582402 RepID=C6XI84_HIRBI|nr:DUF2336 domain-containing protein [Hirschia baltica]ACT58910.1 conserved hypothetical protein [Hirschia baltica ATCC 49814]